MYFVDREQIEKKLRFMETLHTVIPQLEVNDDAKRTDLLALERTVSLYIECVIDVGNSMIDGFIMRDPGSYEDIIDILEDEKVIDSVYAQQLKKLIQLRKKLVQEYDNIDHANMLKDLKEAQHALSQFVLFIRTYLEQELGPVSAFLPKR
ncbi:DUF86 domain-containing protein [Alkalihalobacillus trypoxylicola]|uniref:DUF86 domain-containing protein n=1 Tax=Alkalihalobacillus trypoxylicola TaxID=519424 RepID=A0A161Q8S1_9BACI|nr:DUF86 domain-containing protein [Alkalihalobacillus trypoxylicola]KYG33545.1 hypothetical protein AZF04_16430 [Alkalihalobacillus trypoxylicola]